MTAQAICFHLQNHFAVLQKNSPWAEYAEDIVATSGFAFRMWVSTDLCPTATSLWEFDRQPVWLENGGFIDKYTERLWGRTEEEVKINKYFYSFSTSSYKRLYKNLEPIGIFKFNNKNTALIRIYY